MYRVTYSNCYTKGARPVVGGVKRLRDKAESLKQPATAPKLKEAEKLSPELAETLSRKELGKLFNVSHEAIRQWEENGKLSELGWQRIPYIKSPVKYSRTTPLIAPAAALK
jgi:hypothetical protein